MISERLKKQLDFIIEADKIKNIMRKTKLFDGGRYENDAEHSWSLCLMAMVLAEHANFEVDVLKVMKMVTIHDVIEVYCGDTFLYAKERDDVHEKEDAAARKIFGMLDQDQADELYSLWCEFEARETNEAKFASALDRLEPTLQNYKNEGFTWKQNSVIKPMVIAKNRQIDEGSNMLWSYVETMLDECVAKGYLSENK